MGGILEVIVPVHNIKNRRENLSKLLSVSPRGDTSFIVISDSNDVADHAKVNEIVKDSPNPNSKVVKGDFGSPGWARNAGLTVASARWVTFLDSDDEIDLDALALLILGAEKESAQLAIGGITFASQKTHAQSNYYLDFKISVLANLSLTPAFTRMAFQRNLLSEIVFPNFKMAEDQCFVIDVLALNPRLYLEEIYFYTYLLGDVSQATTNQKALMELPLAIAYIDSQIERSAPDLQQVAITMVMRQSVTYLVSVGIYPNKKLFKILQIVISVATRHPIRTGRAIMLILMHRPRSFV